MVLDILIPKVTSKTPNSYGETQIKRINYKPINGRLLTWMDGEVRSYATISLSP